MMTMLGANWHGSSAVNTFKRLDSFATNALNQGHGPRWPSTPLRCGIHHMPISCTIYNYGRDIATNTLRRAALPNFLLGSDMGVPWHRAPRKTLALPVSPYTNRWSILAHLLWLHQGKVIPKYLQTLDDENQVASSTQSPSFSNLLYFSNIDFLGHTL
jgi:hypothetical protein